VQGEDKRQFSMSIFLPEAKVGLQTLVEKLKSVISEFQNSNFHLGLKLLVC